MQLLYQALLLLIANWRTVFTSAQLRRPNAQTMRNLQQGGDEATTQTDVGTDPISENNQDESYRNMFLDPNLWHPKSRNFELMNWTLFEEKCGNTIPFTYDPVQRYGQHLQNHENIFDPGVFQWGRSQNLPDDVIATGAKPMIGNVSDPSMDLFYGILGQALDPSLVPEPLRNKAFWMSDNIVGELLISFNRAAWRENTEEGRTVGLGSLGYDWTNAVNPTMFGYSPVIKRQFWNLQVSPSGKFMKMFWMTENPSDPNADGVYLDMYVVQEGDAFTDRDGNILDFVQPGDIYRLTVSGRIDPYKCYNDIEYAYFFRTAAVIDELTGDISPGIAYDALIEAVKAEPTNEEKESSQNFTNSSLWTMDERFYFLSKYEPDKQMYLSASEPPSANLLNDIGVETETSASAMETEMSAPGATTETSDNEAAADDSIQEGHDDMDGYNHDYNEPYYEDGNDKNKSASNALLSSKFAYTVFVALIPVACGVS